MDRSKPCIFCSNYLAVGEISSKEVRQKLIANLGTNPRTIKSPM